MGWAYLVALSVDSGFGITRKLGLQPECVGFLRRWFLGETDGNILYRSVADLGFNGFVPTLRGFDFDT